LNLRSIRAMGLGFFACLCALPVLAAPNAGKISGIVLDPAGTPQMGATVLVASETILAASPIRLLTNDRGRFSTDALPAGAYSIHVTLAGFLPVKRHACSSVVNRSAQIESRGIGASLSLVDSSKFDWCAA